MNTASPLKKQLTGTDLSLGSQNRISLKQLIPLVVLVAVIGCSAEEQVSQTQTTPPQVEKEKTETVTAAPVAEAVSPAKKTVKLPDAEASPELVCELFMEYLNKGQRVKAEQLLTATALSTTAKAGLYLQPIGSSDSKVTIKPAVYATNKQRLAQVDCIVEEVEDGKTVSDQLTWFIRKSKSGWRILGFMLKGEDGVQDFLSFENVRDVDAILQMSAETARSPAQYPKNRQAQAETSRQEIK